MLAPHGRGPLPHFTRPLDVALPCIGGDGACVGLVMQGWRLGVDVEPRYAFDLHGWLRAPLHMVHGDRALAFRPGAVDGNILNEDVKWS